MGTCTQNDPMFGLMLFVIYKFFIIFEQGVPHFYFALRPASQVADPQTVLLKLYSMSRH